MREVKEKLKDFLLGAAKVVVLGVGSELRGDDAAGILVANHLKEELKNKNDRVAVLIGGSAPENITGQIKKLDPSHIVIIDAADLGKKAGETALLDPEKIGGDSFSTHRISTRMMSDYLKQSIGCEIIVLGIQPKAIKFGSAISPQIADSARAAVAMLSEILIYNK